MAGADSTRPKPYGVIYMITNVVTGKRYIGQTVGSVKSRWRKHIRDSTGCRRLKNSIAKYGVEAFEIKVIFEASNKDELNEKEVEFINFYDTRNKSKGYNLNAGGGSGRQHAETIERRAQALRGKPLSEEHRRKLSDSHKGYVPSEETRAKMSASRIGKKRGPITEEHAAKLRAARLGKKMGPMPAERKAKIGAANAGKTRAPMSEEQKRKRSEAMKGKPKNWSEEGREQTLEASRKYWEQFRLEKKRLSDEEREVRRRHTQSIWDDPEKKAARLEKCAATRARKKAEAEAAGLIKPQHVPKPTAKVIAAWADPEVKAARLAKCAETRARNKAAKEAAKAAAEAASKAETEVAEA
jgi:group I intron endonuclease